jgi:hypothetical protein
LLLFGTLANAEGAQRFAEGKKRTYDMGGKDSTIDVAKAIAEYASSLIIRHLPAAP